MAFSTHHPSLILDSNRDAGGLEGAPRVTANQPLSYVKVATKEPGRYQVRLRSKQDPHESVEGLSALVSLPHMLILRHIER